ncbi:MAG: phage tail tube protein [Bacteroidota bacterium]
MTIANGAQHSLHYVAETTYGTTPTTPTFKPLPHTGASIGLSKDGIESEKLRGDRQVEDFRHGNKSVAGDITGELEYGAFDDMLEAVFCGTWASDVLKTGTTRRSFTIERKFGDLDTPEYHRHTGCELNTFGLSVAPNSMVTATFGIVGKDLAAVTTQVSGASYSADAGNSPFDSFTGSINEGGSSIATVTALELAIENGIEPLFTVGSQTTSRPSIGKSRATGTLTTYFESKALYEKFLNETSSSLDLTLTDLDGNSYQIELGNVKYNSGQPDVGGEGTITIAMEFVALYDSSDASNIVITRTDA